MNIVMTTFHAGGNVPPFVELGRELARRGHAVTCVAQSSLETVFAEAGVAFRPLTTGTAYRPFDRVPLDGQMREFAKVFFDDGYGTDLVREAALAAADVVVIDSYLFGAMAAAEARGIPAVVLVHT